MQHECWRELLIFILFLCSSKITVRGQLQCGLDIHCSEWYCLFMYLLAIFISHRNVYLSPSSYFLNHVADLSQMWSQWGDGSSSWCHHKIFDISPYKDVWLHEPLQPFSTLNPLDEMAWAILLPPKKHRKMMSLLLIISLYILDIDIERDPRVCTEHTQKPNSQRRGHSLTGVRGQARGGGLPLDQAKTTSGVSLGAI